MAEANRPTSHHSSSQSVSQVVKSNPSSRLFCIELRRIVTCIGSNQKNQPNLDLYLVRRYKICHFPIVVSYLCFGQNQKNQPNMVLYLARRYKIFESVATLHRGKCQECEDFDRLVFGLVNFVWHKFTSAVCCGF